MCDQVQTSEITQYNLSLYNMLYTILPGLYQTPTSSIFSSYANVILTTVSIIVTFYVDTHADMTHIRFVTDIFVIKRSCCALILFEVIINCSLENGVMY